MKYKQKMSRNNKRKERKGTLRKEGKREKE
jgi:hypothetical protein